MADTERMGGGTKRISSGTSSGLGADMEELHSRKPEGVDIIQDNRKSRNANRSQNSQRAGNAENGRSNQNVQRSGSAKTGRDGRNVHRAGSAETGRDNQNVRKAGKVKGGNAKAGRRSQNVQRSGSAKTGRDGQNVHRAGNARAGRVPGKGSVNGNAGAKNSQGAAMHPTPAKRGQRPKRKRSGRKFLIGLLCGMIILAGLGYLVIVLFEVEQIVVTGNQYCSEAEIIDWLKQDPYSDNALYLLWKYNQNDVELLPAVEEAKVGLKDLRTVTVQVKEKTFSGRIDYAGKFLYFDQQGKAALITDSIIEGVPYIEGMEVNEEDIILGEDLPEEKGQVYEEIKELIPLLDKQSLSPDKISCEGTDLTLHFGGVRVQIGNGKFADRLAQVPPILEKLTEMYAGQTGVLHLENYDVSGSSIRFVPDTVEPSAEADAAEPQPEGEGEGEEGAAEP